jgi:hypothetical protein
MTPLNKVWHDLCPIVEANPEVSHLVVNYYLVRLSMM